MKKDYWGHAALGSLLLSLAFPPYFISYLAIAVLGGLGYLLKTLNPEEREELVEFEKEFRKGHALEEAGKTDEALAIYRDLVEQYPKFEYIIHKKLDGTSEKTGENG